MNKIKLKNKILLILILIIAILQIQIPSMAAGSFNVSSANSMKVGDTTKFTLTMVGCYGKFSIKSSDNSVVSITEGDTTPFFENSNGSNSVTLKAHKAGKATITATALDASDTTGENEVTGSRSVTITVTDPTPPPNQNQGGNTNVSSKSGDATLKSITVLGQTYTNPSTDFTVTAKANVKSVEVTAIANNNKAKISGTGAKELTTGTNVVTITVTAENGTVKKYTVRVRKLADETTVPNVTDTPNNNNNNTQAPNNNETPNPEGPSEPKILRLDYLTIDDVELIPSFDSENFEYMVEVTNKEKLNIVAQANIQDATVDVDGNENLKDGENIIIIKLEKDDQSVEYTITVNKKTEEVVLPGTVETDNTRKKWRTNHRRNNSNWCSEL